MDNPWIPQTYPVPQTVGAVADALQKYPRGQIVADDRPDDAQNDPGGQLMAAESPVTLQNEPMGQLTL
jgi:hypothetical protein